MPELAEVETIKNQLLDKIKGKRFEAVKISLPKLVRTDVDEFKKKIVGAKIEDIKRRAKLIIFYLSNGYALIVHLKMTGQLIYKGEKTKHTHLIYNFSDGSHLIHNDMRQFGYVKFVPQDTLDDLIQNQEKYGPEPLEDDFTLDVFKGLLKKRPGMKIKQLLMDQTFVAGIGNIYGDEILFNAQVRPARVVKTLKPKEVAKVFDSIKIILKLAILNRGTSDQWYLDVEGKKGKFQNILKVYRREDKPCLTCGGKIIRLKMGGRSAHYCPKCQK